MLNIHTEIKDCITTVYDILTDRPVGNRQLLGCRSKHFKDIAVLQSTSLVRDLYFYPNHELSSRMFFQGLQ